MRISYINYITRNSNLIVKEINYIAKAMEHKVEERLLYNKIENFENTKDNENIK